jgi:energy-converting hydrogenase Eha subunit H
VQAEPLPTHYLYTRAELAARRRDQQLAYTRWTQRQLAIAEHDRKIRRFLLGFGAIAATGVLTGIGLVAWTVYHALTAVNSGAWLTVLGVAAVILGPAALLGGHRCITVVKHWH